MKIEENKINNKTIYVMISPKTKLFISMEECFMALLTSKETRTIIDSRAINSAY